MNQEYDKFLGKLYDILLNDQIINYNEKAKDLKTKKERLSDYLSKLNRVQNKAMNRDHYTNMLKELYHDKYIMKKENIPDSYFSFLERRYLEEGHGHINLVNPSNDVEKKLKEQHINEVINKQIESLDTWLNYLLSKDSDYLPMWAKVWAFQGMLGIGNLNKEKDGYLRRSNTTVDAFVSFDSEILGKCVELINETFSKDKLTDKEVEKIVSSGSFSKLYGKLLANKKALKKDSDEGIWIKYNYETKEEADQKEKEGKKPEYLKLWESLQGYNTGWCTAGAKSTAKDQICGISSYQGGDFYVYYTKDENEEYKVPRIAIRMDRNKIGEIRGTSEGQNIESNMEKVLEEKLKQFPDANKYKKKVSDMKKLTKMYNEYKIRKLTSDELRFIYEIDGKITGFGYRTDPRIEEIKNCRNKRHDLSIIFNCTEDEIGLTKEDLNHKLIYYHGNLYLSNLTGTEGLALPQSIGGSLYLNGLTNAEGLTLPQSINGSLVLSGLTSAGGLTLPQNIGGGLYLNGLTNAERLALPQNIGGDLDLSGLTSAEGLVLPQNIGGYLYLSNLSNAEGLIFPQSVGGYLDLSNLSNTEGLVLPQNIDGDLDLSGLTSAEGLVLPQNIGGYLGLSGLTSAEGLVLPQSIGKQLFLNGLTSLKNVMLPEQIMGIYYLGKMWKLEEIKEKQKEEINNTKRRGFIDISILMVSIIGIIIFLILFELLLINSNI